MGHEYPVLFRLSGPAAPPGGENGQQQQQWSGDGLARPPINRDQAQEPTPQTPRPPRPVRNKIYYLPGMLQLIYEFIYML